MKPTALRCSATLSLLFLPLLSWAQAASSTALEIAERLETWSTLSMEFVQRTYDDKRNVVSNSRGTLAISRPKRFRLEVTEPDEELSVSDGEKLWMYDPLLKQVQILRLEDRWETAPILLLSGDPRELEKSWVLSATGQKRRQYTLEPKNPEVLLKSITLIFRDNLPSRLFVVDQLDQLIRIDFRKLKTDLPISSELFTFDPPPGVDVLDEDQQQ